jgi:protein TonB
MVKMAQPGGATTTTESTPPAASNPAASNTAKPVEPKPNASANKSRDSRKTVAPDLPAASNAAAKLTSVPVDVKAPAASASQAVPMVDIDSEPPPSPGPRPILKPISGGVLNGTALSLPSPLYPDGAKRMRVQGVVTVDVVLDESGKVISANASSGPAALREAATQAALKARFSPTKLSGQPVKVSGVINYKFTLVP